MQEYGIALKQNQLAFRSIHAAKASAVLTWSRAGKGRTVHSVTAQQPMYHSIPSQAPTVTTFDDDFTASRTRKSDASDISRSASGSSALLKTVVELVACSAVVVSLLLLHNFMGGTPASSGLHLPEWTSNSDEVAC